MTHLRSPSVHHLDLHPWALQRYAGKKKNRKPDLFAPPYDRPALELFNSHCEHVIKEFKLDDIHIKGRAIDCAIDCDKVSVKVSDGNSIEASKVVLALGASEQPEWPVWAPRDAPTVHHVFDPSFDGWPAHEEVIVVVGGGISAAQVALRLLKEGHQVDLVARHDFRSHQFDSDPGWLGPKFMTGFRREVDVDRRRAIISKARHRGSMPPDVEAALKRAITDNRLRWHKNAVESVTAQKDGCSVRLQEGIELHADRILLATGFAPMRPGGKLVDQLIESEKLPCATCGYPVVDKSLRWHPRVYVSGPLAELELGPSSRNIAGARRAADRLVEAARLHRTSVPHAAP